MTPAFAPRLCRAGLLLTITSLVAATGTVSATAADGAAARRSDVPAPAAGHWTMTPTYSQFTTGSLTITKKHLVRKFTLLKTTSGKPSCGHGRLVVKGKMKLRYSSLNEGWISGHGEGTSLDPALVPEKVSVKAGHRRSKGVMSMIFNPAVADDGELNYGPAGACTIYFDLVAPAGTAPSAF